MRIEVVVEKNRITIFGDVKSVVNIYHKTRIFRAFCRYMGGYWECGGGEETMKMVLEEIIDRAGMNDVEVVIKWRRF